MAKSSSKIAYATKIKRCVNIGDVSGVFEFFVYVMVRYRFEMVNGMFK